MINILNRYENRWDKLATDQAPIFLGDHAKEMADEVTRLFKAFDKYICLCIFAKEQNLLSYDVYE